MISSVPTFVTRIFAAALLLTGIASAEPSNLAAEVAKLWPTKTVILRAPDASKRSRFTAEGQRIGTAEPGLWATDSMVRVDAVEVRGQKLEIAGTRIALYLDPEHGKFVREWTPIEVRIEVELPAKNATLNQVTPALEKIFATGENALADSAPAHWNTCLKGEIVRDGKSWKCQYKAGAPDSSLLLGYPSSGQPLPNDVKPPIAVRTVPEPEYTQVALHLSSPGKTIQGKTILGFVVDTDGRAKNIQILSPIGLGLDDQAVRALEQWKFEPATRAGVPIPFGIKLQVNFHHY